MPSRSPVGPCVIYRNAMTQAQLSRGWQEKALCNTPEIDPEIFFSLPSNSRDISEAKRLCGQCPVKAKCLQYSIQAREPYGIWGGATPTQRAAMIKAIKP